MSAPKNKIKKLALNVKIKIKAKVKTKKVRTNSVVRNAEKMSTKMTWPEREFKKLLTELGIKHEAQKVIGKKIFDFYATELNILFEVDGDYYHANPLLFKEEDLNKLQARNIRNDKYKESLARGLGYKVERVWEYDLKNNYDAVKLRIKKMISK